MPTHEFVQPNAADPAPRMIDPPIRRETLLAHRDGGAYVFDIHLQGGRETVFFDA